MYILFLPRVGLYVSFLPLAYALGKTSSHEGLPVVKTIYTYGFHELFLNFTLSQLKYLCKKKKSDIIRLITGKKIFCSYLIFDEKFIALQLPVLSITISSLYNMQQRSNCKVKASFNINQLKSKRFPKQIFDIENIDMITERIEK